MARKVTEKQSECLFGSVSSPLVSFNIHLTRLAASYSMVEDLFLVGRFAVLLLLTRLHRQRRQGRHRQMWVRQIFQRRLHLSEVRLVEEMRQAQEILAHIKFLRITPNMFDYLLERLKGISPASQTWIQEYYQTEHLERTSCYHVAFFGQRCV